MENVVLKVREIGDPILKKKCKKVDIKNIDDEVLEIIKNMKSTLEYSKNCSGLSAPQLGYDKRITIISVDTNCTYDNTEAIPTTVMINPTWKNISDKKNIAYEACMSVPAVRGQVERYTDIEVVYYDENMKKIKKVVHDFTARLIQHECDHLDGYVFLEKVTNGNYSTRENLKNFDSEKK